MKVKRGIDQIVRALTLSTPFAIGARWDSYAHCVIMSVTGACALNHFGVKAQPTLCATVLINERESLNGSFGLTPKQVYDRMCWDGFERQSFEDWYVDHPFSLPSDLEDAIHCVIHVPQGSRSFLLADLTFGQLRSVFPSANTPLHLVVRGPKWPQAEVGDWRIKYEPSSQRKEFLKRVRSDMRKLAHNQSGLVSDLTDLMGLALDVDCDFDRFRDELKYLAGHELWSRVSQNLRTALRVPESDFE